MSQESLKNNNNKKIKKRRSTANKANALKKNFK